MSKYRFRLETVRKLRAIERDERRSSLADAYRAEGILSDQRAALDAEQAELNMLRQTAVAQQPLDMNTLLEAQRYEMVLKANAQILAEQASRLAIEVERRRQIVVEADRAVRVLDLLDERRHRQHRRETERRDTKILDEVAMTRQVRHHF